MAMAVEAKSDRKIPRNRQLLVDDEGEQRQPHHEAEGQDHRSDDHTDQLLEPAPGQDPGPAGEDGEDQGVGEDGGQEQQLELLPQEHGRHHHATSRVTMAAARALAEAMPSRM